jgi:hypothetical protein
VARTKLRREWTDEALAKALAGRPAAPIRDVVGFSSKALKQPNPNKVWMEVTLGTGKVVRSKQSMWLGSRPQLDRLGRSGDTDKIEKK